MKMLAWLRGRISPTYRAKWLYRRGMLRAKAHRQAAAIEDYTAVLAISEAPSNIRGMALYNRALVHSAMGNEPAAISDLKQILSAGDITEQIKTEARRKLLRMDRNADRAST